MAAPNSYAKCHAGTTLVSKSYGDDVVGKLRLLQQNDVLCDFTITADGKSLKVHKILLVATSEYFRAMLRGCMKESKEDSVDLGGITSASLEMIVDFIYSGTMNLNTDCLIEVLNAANHLQIQSALDLCSDYVISLLTFANADELVQIAEMYSLGRVLEFYAEKVLAEFKDFAGCKTFLALSAKQLVAYLSDDRLKVRSESGLLDLIERWANHDAASRVDSLVQVVQCVRFGLLSKPQLQIAMHHKLMKCCPAMAARLRLGIQYHNESASGHPSATESARLRSVERSLVLVHQGSSLRKFEVVAYDDRSARFHNLASDTDGCRDCRVATVDDFVYICRVVDSGGGTLISSLLRFDPRHLTLTMLTSGRQPRIDPALVACGHRIYIFGGCVDVPQGTSGNTVLDSVEYYDIRGNVWSSLGPLPTRTHSHAAVLANKVVYITGGITDPGRVATSDVVVYDPTTDSYAYKSPMNCARRLHEMAVLDGAIYVLGGIGSHSFHQHTQISLERYAVEADQWTMLSTTLAGRSVGHFVAFRDAILSLGREHHQATEDDIWRYDVGTDVWSTYMKAPDRTSLSSTTGVMLNVNFFDEKIVKTAIVERR